MPWILIVEGIFFAIGAGGKALRESDAIEAVLDTIDNTRMKTRMHVVEASAMRNFLFDFALGSRNA